MLKLGTHVQHTDIQYVSCCISILLSCILFLLYKSSLIILQIYGSIHTLFCFFCLFYEFTSSQEHNLLLD